MTGSVTQSASAEDGGGADGDDESRAGGEGDGPAPGRAGPFVAREVRGFRNRWAHQKPFTSDEGGQPLAQVPAGRPRDGTRRRPGRRRKPAPSSAP